MKRLCLALALACLLLLVAGVGTASADSVEPDSTALTGTPETTGPAEEYTMDASAPAPAPDTGSLDQSNGASSDGTAGNANATKQDADQGQGSSGTQVIGQSASNDQDALALALTVQKNASNTNAPVNVLSKGGSGDVTQENTATSDATAGNLNLTKQDADQEQKGDCKCTDGGKQAIGQTAKNEQDAAALAKTVQEKPSNTNVSVRVLSPGDNGDVTQTNTASSDATAGNLNLTKQDADQKAGGHDCKCTEGGTQAIGQSADSEQKAFAAAETVQVKPSNRNISVRVLSPGDDGDVTQSNTATSNATAGNINATEQDADQDSAGSGTQAIGQLAKNDQKATALAGTIQVEPSNTNISVRVLSPGTGGDVKQTNTATSNATAGNLNVTKQDADQKSGGDCKCTDGKQVIGQFADSEQDAKALATTLQVKPSNTNTSVRVLSKGDDGDVTQSNTATSDATAANLNLTKQDADQASGGAGIQAIGQAAKNDQDATALAATFQLGASNTNAPVRVLSDGHGGSVTQSNTASSDAFALNANLLSQDADQWQGGKDGDKHDCCGTGIQAIGQLAKNEQDAKAAALTVQLGVKRPCSCSHKPTFGNSNHPVSVGSKGDSGSVKQSNTATSDADALNLNATSQEADQGQHTSCKCWEALGIQAIGQLVESEQKATALAATFQLGATNTSAPVSSGDGGHGHDRDHKGHDAFRE